MSVLQFLTLLIASLSTGLDENNDSPTNFPTPLPFEDIYGEVNLINFHDEFTTSVVEHWEAVKGPLPSVFILTASYKRYRVYNWSIVLM